MRQSTGQKLRKSRAFFFALVAVFVIWVVSAMSEEKRFREPYKLVFDNIDTANYALTHSDTLITLDITSNGFSAFNRSRGNKTLHLDIGTIMKQHKDDTLFSVTLRTDNYLDIFKRQFDMHGVSEVTPVNESFSLRVATRRKKAFVADISNVTFNFDKTAGLCGEPRITPDTIYLYGSSESLAKINRIAAVPQTIDGIKQSGKYKVALNPVWKRYSDLRISHSSVDVFIPVEQFVETSIKVPVTLTDKKDDSQWNLYPYEVTVSLLVPKGELPKVDASQYAVTASVNDISDNTLSPQLTTFPSNVRLKSIVPERIQFTIIEKD